jgi:signal peptidase I
MRHLTTNGLAALSVLTLIACSDVTDLDGPDGRELQKGSMLNLDVAMVSADAFIEDVAELQFDFSDVIEGVFAEPGDTVRVRPDPLKHVREIIYYDADGNKQDTYDGITTASVNIVSEISGERARDNWSSSVSRTRDITITGLEGSEVARTANGFGSSTQLDKHSRSYHSDENGNRSYEMSGTSTIQNVVRTVPEEENNPFVRRERDLYPLSGTITRDVNVIIVNGPNGDETHTKHVVIVFNGTQFVTMTVDGESLEVDLAARKGRHPLRGRGGNGVNCRGNGPPPGAGNGGNRPPPPNCRGNSPPPLPGMGNRPPQPPSGGEGYRPPPVRRGSRPPPISG